MRSPWVLAICALAVTSGAGAQGVQKLEWPLDSGSRIRVRSVALGQEFQSGKLIATTADSIKIAPDQRAPLSIATNKILTLHIARGTHDNKRKYALAGFLFGAVTGTVIGLSTYSPCEDCGLDFGESYAAITGGFVGAGLGTILGYAWGSAREDTWIPVKIPSQ